MRRSLEAHLGSRDVARVIYGSIIGLALIVALQAHPPGVGQTIAALVGTAVAVALAELYSEIVAHEAITHEATHLDKVRELAGEAGAVFFGVAFPAIFFLLAAVGLIERQTAYTLAKWTGVGLICAYGFLAARLSGAGPVRATVQAVIVGLIGVGLILLKTLTH
jgi:VIT1/CCC1 family predicted Fe2+/Mn2+ transporter